METLKISVIITTYNRSDALKAVLRSLTFQTSGDFEVIVADDGSDNQTRYVVKHFKNIANFPIEHVWQENLGFRAGKIRNIAVSKAHYDYLLFLDGDCIVRPRFIEYHRRLAERGWLVAGNRLLLNPDFTEKILQNDLVVEHWGFKKWWQQYRLGACHGVFRLLPLPLGFLRKLANQSWQGAKTCNLGLWKSDFYLVNGFDESFQGWGYEDSDLVLRLFKIGIRRKWGQFAVTAIHLWHSSNLHSPEQQKNNWQRLQETMKNVRFKAVLGVEQY